MKTRKGTQGTSDEEVWARILYLDPELDQHTNCGQCPDNETASWVVPIILLIGVVGEYAALIFYFSVSK
jgi:hypothetical protein